jgi:hypothetical protein
MFKSVTPSSTILTDTVKKQLESQDDPLDSSRPAKKMAVKRVWSVLPPDHRGFEEVLYTDNDDQPMTALVVGKAREIVSIEIGW